MIELWQLQISVPDCQGCADACVVFPLYGVFSPVFFVIILADDFVLLNKHYYY